MTHPHLRRGHFRPVDKLLASLRAQRVLTELKTRSRLLPQWRSRALRIFLNFAYRVICRAPHMRLMISRERRLIGGLDPAASAETSATRPNRRLAMQCRVRTLSRRGARQRQPGIGSGSQTTGRPGLSGKTARIPARRVPRCSRVQQLVQPLLHRCPGAIADSVYLTQSCC
jgi:hypothetical protein